MPDKRSISSKVPVLALSLVSVFISCGKAALAAPAEQEVKPEQNLGQSKALEPTKPEGSPEQDRSSAGEAQSGSSSDSATKRHAKVEAETKKVAELAVQILIDAPPDIVWTAIHEERDSAPGLASSKILAQENNHYRLEQKYTLVPFMSSITRVLDVDEIPNERISYKVVPSGHDKPLEGNWILKPEDENKKTSLTLTAESARIGNSMLKRAAAKLWIERRLAHVKQYAERANHLRLEGRVLPKGKL